jgi:hypothetical protein
MVVFLLQAVRYKSVTAPKALALPRSFFVENPKDQK